MSCVVVISPLVIAGWPVITAAVTAAVSSMGFNIVQSHAASVASVAVEPRTTTKTRVDIELEDSEILKDAVANDQIVVEREGMRAIFSRDERGALKLCMEGEAHSKSDL